MELAERTRSTSNTSIPSILERVGNTPLVSLQLREFDNVNLFVKVESYNPTGSVKDRAASYILKTLLRNKVIDKNTTIIESTSGNFGVALSAYCKYFGLKFVAVVDPNINAINETLIRANGAEIVKVTQPDQHGGYLLTRIEKIKTLQKEIENSYWVNQYQNPLNAMAYYQTLGKELCFQIEEVDYVFIGVSSGGTITGVSRKIKENFPVAKVIAVDVDGSVIFSNASGKKRFIPGIGSSMVPEILKEALIDDVVVVDEIATINACHELLHDYNFFVGGSSGSVIAGIKKFFSQKAIDTPLNVVSIFADRGERYFETIYNSEWCNRILSQGK
jgi:N-(2-amino-2-carboxyethyl)-L-glutamate synthase